MPVQAGPGLRFRRITFAIFLASFVITTGLVLLEGNGFVIHFPSRTLLTTGSMLVKVEPTDALVTVAGITHTEGSPVRVTRITPRTVPVHIEAPGYHPWSKRLAIDPQHTTFVDTILIRDAQPTVIQTFPASHIVSLSPDGATVLEWNPNTASVTSTKITVHTQTGSVLHTITTPFAPSQVVIHWSTDSARAAITWSTGTRHATFIYSSVRQEFSGALEHDYLSFVRWDAASPWVAVVRNADGSLSNFHAITYEVTPRTGDDTPLTRDKHSLYVSDTTTHSVSITPLTGDDEPTVLPIEATHGSSNESTTLLTNDFEVWYSHQGSSFALLARTSDPILAAYPIPTMPYAVLFTKSRVQVLEYDGRDVRASYAVFTDRNVHQLGVEKNGRKLRAITTEASGEQALVDLVIR